MAWLASATSLKSDLELASLLIIDTHDAIRTTSGERGTIWFVVYSEQLIQFIMDGVQEFAACSVPVLERSIGVHGNQHVLSYSWCGEWSPSIAQY